MKRLPILVIESRYVHHRGGNYRSGCSACVMFQDNKCKEAFHLPNETSMPCLSSTKKPWGAHYEWSQHKISVSRNKREGKYFGKGADGTHRRAGRYDYRLGQRLGTKHAVLSTGTGRVPTTPAYQELPMTYDQAYNTMYPPRERQAKHAQWGRGRG